jgi:DNA polymerase/3'-5' exonuclease PolX
MWLAEGQRIANGLLKVLDPFCERIAVAGSIRRQKPEVHDIDLVLIPQPLTDIVGILQRSLNAKVLKKGPKVVNLEIEGVGVDLNYATHETFNAILLFRTGSEVHNTMLAAKARRMGLRFSPYGVFTEDGKRLDDNTEEGIFRVLAEEFREPNER